MVSKCPEWKTQQKVAQYFSSANQGLGFLHVEVDSKEDKIRLWDASTTIVSLQLRRERYNMKRLCKA
jgi:hypothetical protein